MSRDFPTSRAHHASREKEPASHDLAVPADVPAVFASVAYTETATSDDQANPGARGVQLFLDVTAMTGDKSTLDLKLQAKDPLSGKYLDIPDAKFPRQKRPGLSCLTIYPGIADGPCCRVNDVLPRTWRAVATISGADPSCTFSLSASYVL